MPATVITILDVGVGTLDGFLSPTDGVITTADGGAAPGTLSRAALQGVGPGVDIDIAATSGFVVSDLTSTLALQTAVGNSASFNAGAGSFAFTDTSDSFTIAGGKLFLSATSATLGGLNTTGGDIDINADNMSLNQTINAGAGTVRLDTLNPATVIDLGGADGAGTLGLTGPELDFATAGVLIVGNAANTGAINVTLGIAPAGTNQLELETDGQIKNNGGTITETRLGLTAGSNIGAVASTLKTSVSNLEAFTKQGGIFIDNTGSALTIGGVNATLSGVNTNQNSIGLTNTNTITISEGISIAGVTGNITVTTSSNNIAVNAAVTNNSPAGNVTITAEDDVNVTQPISTTGSGSISLTAEPGPAAGSFTNSGLGIITTTNGNIQIQAADNVTLGAAVLAGGTGNIKVIAEPITGFSAAAGNFNSAGTGTLTTNNGDISIQAGDSITVGAAVNAGGGGAITIAADAAIDEIGKITNTAGGTITTTGGNVFITAFDAVVGGTIDAGTGRVAFDTARTTNVIHLGTNTAFGISDAELNFITAGVVRVGSLSNTGGIIIDGAVTRHAGFDTLTLQTGGGISQTAPLAVAKAAIQASSGDVILTNAGNDVDFIAGTGNNLFNYADVNGFEVSGVDIRAGIFLGGAGTGDIVTLTAGGAVTQTPSQIIHVDNLLFLGTGSFKVNDPGNDASTFAANVTNSVTYTDSNGLTIGSVSGTDGVTTSASAITITASAQVSDTTLTVNKAITSAGGPVTLSGDVMAFNSTVNAGGGIATLAPTTVGREIDLGTNPSAGKLGIAQADLDKVTGGTIVVGSATAGNLSITQAITPTTTNRLDLVTGGQIIDANGGTDLTVSNLVLIAKSGIGITAPNFELDTIVDKLEARTTNGGINVSEINALTIGGITPALTGVNVVTSGNINISANGTLSLADTTGLQVVGGGSTSGDIFLNAFGATSDVASAADGDAIAAPRGSITVNAGRDILFGTAGADFDNDVRSNNGLTFNAGRDITVDGFSDVAADDFGQNTGGNVIFTAGNDINITDFHGNDASVGNSGSTGSITFSAANFVILASEVFTNGSGAISITYDSDNGFNGDFASGLLGTVSTNGGSITIQGGSDSAHGNAATIGGAITVTGGAGAVTANSANDVFVVNAVSVTGTGGIFITADSNSNASGFFTNFAAGTLTTAGGVISITANVVAIGGAINTTTKGFANVFLQPSTNAAVIHLGTDAGFGVTDTEADLITANALIIGTANNTGGIQLTGQVSLDATKVKTLELLTDGSGGAITDNTAGEQADITVQDLLLFADSGLGTGVGTPGNLDIDVTNLAAHNTNAATGAINLFNFSSTLNITGTGTGFFTAFGVQNSNATAATGPVSIHTLGDLNIKSSVAAGNANNVVFQSADDLTVEAGATVQAGGTVSAFIDAGNADAGTGATATIAGKITATSLSVTGNTDSDTFNITPSATTPISVDGDNPTPPASPGDSLNIDVTGTTGLALTRNSSANGLSGNYQFTNRAKVNFQKIETLSPDAVDLSILMADTPDPVIPGGKITYTITVNNGDSVAQNVQLSDTLPANTTFVSFSAPTGWTTVTPTVGGTGIVTATRATLPANSASQVFTLVVHVNGNTPNNTIINNTAKVNSSTIELNPSNNVAAAATTAKQAVLPVVVGADAGGGSQVKVFDPVTGALTKSFFAYPGFGGGVRVAAGDINGDGVTDIITAAGPIGGPHVKAFDGVTGTEIRSFFAYAANFTGGVFVAVGDINEDGFGDIITGADAGGGPHVQVFSGQNGKVLASYYAYSPDFAGGVRVAAGDVNGDGKADIITGAGPTGGPHVTARSGADLSLLRSFFAYDASVTKGVYVASGDLNNDGRADIITGVGKGSPSHTIVYSGLNNTILHSFLAYDAGFTGGVRVAVADFGGDGQLDFVTGAGFSGGPHVRVFQGNNQAQLNSFFAFDPTFLGGIFVG